VSTTATGSPTATGPRILVAGIGNIFCSDDGFGSAVAQQLAAEVLPEGVEVADIGIRGVHLAYQLLDGYDVLVLIDAYPRGEAPGTVTLLEPRVPAVDRAAVGAVPVDAHGMEPVAVLGLLERLGAQSGNAVGRVLLVGCEPADVADGIGLSAAVSAAVPVAAARVHDLVGDLVARSDPAGARGEQEVRTCPD
jgi:hydrogenase maturation protease